MARVFVSHASEDRALAGEVHRWLVEAGHEVFLDQDLRDGIAPGEEWEQRLHERLRWANAMLCVVTSAYLKSTWCAAEVGIARSRGSQLLPLRAEPDAAHPLLTSLHYIDYPADPPTARAAVITAVHRVDATWPDDRSPFPGLRPFEVDQHQIFFGRADEVDHLAELLRSPAERAEGAALLVVGPSGCGKSSLVRAGLLPVLANEPGWRTLPPILPDIDPVAALTKELAAAARQSGLDWTVDHVHHQLGQRGLTGLADELLLADPAGPQRHLLIVVDQFEELLTQTSPAERGRFTDLLRPALTGPVRVVATLRPEFLDQMLLDPDLATLPTRPYTLRPLGREALRAVIEKPSRLAGITVDDEMVDRLVDDTVSGEALPLLAFTLAQLAEGVTRGGRLSSTRYDQLGGVQGALTRQADAALAHAVTASGRNNEQVIAGLLRLVTVDEQGHPTRWRVRRDELPTPVGMELDAFIAHRLLTTDTDNGAVVIGVAHEAFLSTWPPLNQAITANVSALRARRAVEHAATDWHDHARPPARLWTGGQLAAAVTDTGARLRTGTAPTGTPPTHQASRWMPRRRQVLITHRVTLSSQARDFLHTSIRHDRRRRRRTVTVLSILLILALAAAGIAVVQRDRAQEREQHAQEQTRLATVRQLTALADAARLDDPRTAARLSLAAHQIDPGDETQASLVATLTSTPHYANTLTGHTGPVLSVAFALDKRTLATASEDRTVILWDITDRTQPHPLGAPLTGHAGPVRSVAFTPNALTLATASDDGTVILWDITDRTTQPRPLGTPLTGHTGPVRSVAFSPDGHTLVTGSHDGTAILWDITDRTQPRRLDEPLSYTGPVHSVAFSPDGHTLATTGDGGGHDDYDDDTVVLWDLTDRTQPRPLGTPLIGHNFPVNSVVFASDGRTLATASDDFSVILWDITDRTQPRRLGAALDHTRAVRSVAFAPNGHTLATTSDNGNVALWDITNRTQPRPLDTPLTGHTDAVGSVAFAPDGPNMATAGDDGTAILWDLTDRIHPRRLGAPLTGHTGPVYSVAFTPDGHTLATADGGGTVILWDITDGTQPRPLGTPLNHTRAVRSVTFARDGHTLATASDDFAVILWDITDRTQPRPLGAPLTGHKNLVHSVAFAPNEPTLATASHDGTVILWDITNRTQPRPLGTPLTGHTNAVSWVAFAPNEPTLATASLDGTVILWDITDRTQPRPLGTPLTGHTNWVYSVAFAPNGRTLATAGEDRTVILWDITDRTQPRRLGTPLTDHAGAVASVAFAPNGRTLATVGNSRTMIRWNLTDRTQPRPIGTTVTDHTTTVGSVVFAPGGQTLATSNCQDLWMKIF